MEIAPVRMLSPVWAKGPAEIKNGEIILDEGRAEEYGYSTPEQSEQMTFDLAVIGAGGPDEKEVSTFVRRYGLLFHGANDLGSGECRESLQDWWTEAGRLNFVGAFYQTIQDAKNENSARPVQDFLRRHGAKGFPFLDPHSEHFVEDYISAASIRLQGMINEGLNEGSNEAPPTRQKKRRSWWGLAAVGPGEFRLTQYPPDLLTRAYSAFALLIATNTETEFCRVCGRQFRPASKNSPPACKHDQSTYRSWRRRGDPRAASR